jgi:protein-disulfide isomerase
MERRALVVLLAAAAVAGALIGASQLSARDAAPAIPTKATAPATAGLFAGIPQHGAALGSPDAPVTLVEYADLQCPYCAEWARRTLPRLVSRYVRTGRLRIVFRGLAFVGPESRLALDTAVAAGAHNRLWNVVDALYLAQGPENGGWVTDGLLADVAAGAGLDYGRLAGARGEPWVADEIAASDSAARAAGVRGTPTFQVGRTGGELVLVRPHSLDPDGIVPQIEAVLRGD